MVLDKFHKHFKQKVVIKSTVVWDVTPYSLIQV
jgi:hypothetical protein